MKMPKLPDSDRHMHFIIRFIVLTFLRTIFILFYNFAFHRTIFILFYDFLSHKNCIYFVTRLLCRHTLVTIWWGKFRRTTQKRNRPIRKSWRTTTARNMSDNGGPPKWWVMSRGREQGSLPGLMTRLWFVIPFRGWCKLLIYLCDCLYLLTYWMVFTGHLIQIWMGGHK